jgi:hypothetical protein
MKANTLIFGVTFFADPLIWRGLDFLNRKFPNWQKLLEIQKYGFGFDIGDLANMFLAQYFVVFRQMLNWLSLCNVLVKQTRLQFHLHLNLMRNQIMLLLI